MIAKFRQESDETTKTDSLLAKQYETEKQCN